VQHDPLGFLSLFPSAEVYNERLNDIFVAYTNAGPMQSENILPNVGYWGGNEPSLFHPFMFAYGDRVDLTQYWTRYVIEDLYSNEPGGVPGNDDFATLSAWLSFTAALGFYPNPPHTHYVLSSPIFAQSSFRFGNGNTLTVIAHNNTNANVFVDSVLWNGSPLPTFPFIEHADIIQGGRLEFFMSSVPNISNKQMK